MTPVPLLDLKRQYAPLREAIEARVREVMDSQGFILGPAVEAFENAARDYCGADWAVGMSSGTDAQLAVLMALGIGPGDAVLTTPFTFFATAGCVSRVGARPVFADIDAQTFNLSPAALAHYLNNVARRDAAGVLRAPTGERLRAIVPVHLFGQCAAMAEILPLAREFGLPVLEDASQALGAECILPDADGNGNGNGNGNGSRVAQAGAMGEMGWFSFFPSKNLGAFGDAGMTTGRDAARWLPTMRAMRMHGMEQQYYHRFVGGNFRLDALQAAVLSVKLPHLNAWSDQRRANAQFYREAFARAGLLEKVRLPHEAHAAPPETAPATSSSASFASSPASAAPSSAASSSGSASSPASASADSPSALPVSAFSLQHSAFSSPPSAFRLPPSALRLPHIYHQYVVQAPAAERDRLRAHLTARGIGSAIYYPLALHQQECFRPLGYAEGDFPHAEAAARGSLALPIFPELTREEQNAVVAAFADFYS